MALGLMSSRVKCSNCTLKYKARKRVGFPYLMSESASICNEENLEYTAPPPFPCAELFRKDDAFTLTTAASNAAIAPPDALEMQAEKFALKILTITDADSAVKAPPKFVAEHAWALP